MTPVQYQMERSALESILESQKPWSEANEQVLQKPYLHIANQPGKKFRSKLINIFNAFYNVPQKYVAIVCEVIDILHNASLLIDDIEDNSQMRRGVKTSHMIYGIPMTINSANYMYFKAEECIHRLAECGKDEFSNVVFLQMQVDLLQVFGQELQNLHRGQGLELYWRDSNVTPTVEMYFEMARNKTGGLFRLACRLLETVAKCYDSHNAVSNTECMNFENSLIPLCNLLGVVYQIRDDYLNLVDDKMTSDKGFAEDITEGKLSFPIIHALTNESTRTEANGTHTSFLRSTILARTDDTEEKKKFVDILKHETRSLEYTKQTLHNLASLIREGDYFPVARSGHPFNTQALSLLQSIVEHLSTV